MKLYAVVSFWCDELFGGGELSINSPFYTSREEAEKHMYAREVEAALNNLTSRASQYIHSSEKMR